MEAAAKKPKVGNDLTQGSIYKTLIHTGYFCNTFFFCGFNSAVTGEDVICLVDNDRIDKSKLTQRRAKFQDLFIGYFPDAPTERGVKHLHELAQAQQAGYRCAVAFVIQMEGITEVRPNVSTQPEFGTALAEAKAAGVRVLFLLCHVGRDSLEIVEQREG